jgi:hypothetical protein
MGLAVSLPPMSSNDLDGSGITCICQRNTEQCALPQTPVLWHF